MPVHNREIAEHFSKLADLLEIEGANPYRIRAYRNAARTITNLSQSLVSFLEEGRNLAELPDIGESIAQKIETYVKTGTLPQLEAVERRTPGALSELMKVEGLGPKRVQTLHKALKIRSLEDLKRAARSGRISQLRGFGKKTEATILRRLEQFHGEEARMPLPQAEELAQPLVAYLRATEGVKDVTVAGSYRRRKETVGDLDILVTARKGSLVMERFTRYDEVVEVISQGSGKSTVILRSGLHVDLRLVPQVSYGAALYYFTGSKAHNIAVRTMAVKKGYKINEYGVFKGRKRLGGRTEQEVFSTMGLPYIEPELRENRGEIEAAREGRLPMLIREQDIRGDLHCHTTATDGHHSLQQMAEAARERGYQYLAITDHTKHVSIARGQNKTQLLRKIREIDKLNARLDGIVILKSAEVDILEDGSLDLPDSVLKELDITVCSIHYKFNLPSQKQTERILRAMDNPYFNILGHPSGRLINERDAYEVDLTAVLKAARDRGCFMELNAQPSRLDLSDSACKLARDMGVKLAISSDAHSIDNLGFMRYGIDQARRGWIEAKDVLNTRGLRELKHLLRRY